MGATILLADDSITIQKVIELTFAETEHRVVAVGSGRDLLAKVGPLNPDAVLCDVVMPDMNGYDICQKLKSDPATLHIPVVLLTGTFEPFDRSRALAAGCDAIVTKPFEAEELIRTVEELLRRKPQGSTTVPAGLEAVGVPEGVPALDFTTTGLERMGVRETAVEPEIPEHGLDFSSSGVGAPPPPLTTANAGVFGVENVPAPAPGAAEELLTAAGVAASEDDTFPSARPAPAGFARKEGGEEEPGAVASSGWLGEDLVAAEAATAPWEETVVAPPGESHVAPASPPAEPTSSPMGEAAGLPSAVFHPGPTLRAGGEPASLTDEEVDRIARRVLELATPLLERIAWEVIPDTAEMLVRKRIRELEAAAEQEM